MTGGRTGARLASLAGGADRPTWWAPWTDVVPDWLRTFVSLEGLARTVSDYATFGVPALLQTHDYSLGVTAGGSRVRPDHTEQVVGLRMDRNGGWTRTAIRSSFSP